MARPFCRKTWFQRGQLLDFWHVFKSLPCMMAESKRCSLFPLTEGQNGQSTKKGAALLEKLDELSATMDRPLSNCLKSGTFSRVTSDATRHSGQELCLESHHGWGRAQPKASRRSVRIA